MDEFHGDERQRWAAPDEAGKATRRSKDGNGPANRPLHELTIRDLIVELAKIDDAHASRTGAEGVQYSEQYLSRRESLIISELHRKRALLPAATPAEPLGESTPFVP